MNTNGQRFWNSLTASRANLACPVGMYFNHRPTSLLRFVGQKVEEHTPRAIGDGFAQMSVPDHTLDIEVFYVDSAKVLYIVISDFMQKIFALIGYPLLCLGNEYSSLVSAIGTLLLPAEASLPSPQELLGSSEVLGILDGFTGGIDAKGLNANIDADFGGYWGKFSDGNIIAGESNEPFACRCSSDSHSFNSPLDRSGEKEFESADVSDVEIFTFKLPSGLFEREGIASVLAPKPWESDFISKSSEKALEGPIEPLRNILKNLGSHILKFWEGRFEFWKLGHLFICTRSQVIRSEREFSPLVESRFIPSVPPVPLWGGNPPERGVGVGGFLGLISVNDSLEVSPHKKLAKISLTTMNLTLILPSSG